ncbi:MAG: malonate transporter [Desulfovibrionales bacterium]|nr:malonate transporter [Desulfovibrionales bacterium]
MFTALIQILPVFLIIAFGALLDLSRLLPKQAGSIIGTYVLYVALPLLLLRTMAGASLDEVMRGGFWIGMIAAQLAIYGLGYFGELFLDRRGHGPAAVTALSCSCSNMAFIGLPVIMSVLPGNHEALVATGFAMVSSVVVTAPCQMQLEFLKYAGDQDKGFWPKLAHATLHNPFVVATVLGLLLGLTRTRLWAPLDGAAEMVGATAAPCMLLALGLDLRDKVRAAFSRKQGVGVARLVLVNTVRLVVSPLLAWGLLAWLGVAGVWLAVGVITSGAGSALLTYVVAEVYQQLPEDTALIAVVSNILSLFTLSILITALRSQGAM